MVAKKISKKRESGNQKSKKSSLTKEKMQKRVEERQKKEKELIIEELKKNPIVTAVCQKTGIGQSTFYRWQTEDMAFKLASEAAIKEGNSLVNDLAKSMLIGKIKNGEDKPMFYWLDRRHPEFMDPKFIPSQSESNKKNPLTPERRKQILENLKR